MAQKRLEFIFLEVIMNEIIDVEMLFIDIPTGRMFHASQKDIESAKNQLNELIALNGQVTMDDYVKALGLYNESDSMTTDIHQMLGIKEGPIEFIMNTTASGIKLDINKAWSMINSPWDS
jgi:hypothetical protein